MSEFNKNHILAAQAILRMQHKMPDGVIHDADTVLSDIIDDIDTEVSGVGYELIQLFLQANDKTMFCRMFEVMTGVTWDRYLTTVFHVMTKQCKAVPEPEIGEWLDIHIDELYVPDKGFTTYHTSQTCSSCGVRTKFVGEAPFINDQYCPVCGKQMKKVYTFNHHPYEPKDINAMQDNNDSAFHKPEPLE